MLIDLIHSQLEAAEKTPDWDLQKLRMHSSLLHTAELYMNQNEAQRYQAINARIQQGIRKFQGYARKVFPADGR